MKKDTRWERVRLIFLNFELVDNQNLKFSRQSKFKV